MIYHFGPYQLDAQRGELRCASHPVVIEPKVFDVLVYLLQHRDRIVTKEELLEHCWAGTFVSEAALTRCLAKVRKVIEPALAGAPVIQTRYGRGYRFVAPVTEQLPAPVQPRQPLASTPTPDIPQRSTILIVDDEPFNVDYLEQTLAELGYATISATNGQEALDKVAADAPDLILLDVMMPVMDGFTVCRLLKDQEETQLIPIIIMTALDAKADRIAGIQAGADDFLTKPVDEAELVARIETALKLKHTVDRRLGEFSALKDQVAQLVHFVTPRNSATSSRGHETL
jgi:DNA-binding response OmpR family regulator